MGGFSTESPPCCFSFASSLKSPVPSPPLSLSWTSPPQSTRAREAVGDGPLARVGEEAKHAPAINHSERGAKRPGRGGVRVGFVCVRV